MTYKGKPYSNVQILMALLAATMEVHSKKKPTLQEIDEFIYDVNTPKQDTVAQPPAAELPAASPAVESAPSVLPPAPAAPIEPVHHTVKPMKESVGTPYGTKHKHKKPKF